MYVGIGFLVAVLVLGWGVQRWKEYRARKWSEQWDKDWKEKQRKLREEYEGNRTKK
jgi:hypothetical protein